MNKKEEQQLFAEYAKSKSAKIRDQIIMSVHNTVKKIARSIYNSNQKMYLHNVFLNIDDLVQEGMRAVVHAFDMYNPNRGIKFITYAYTVALHEMVNFVKKHNKSVVPQDIKYKNEDGEEKEEFDKESYYPSDNLVDIDPLKLLILNESYRDGDIKRVNEKTGRIIPLNTKQLQEILESGKSCRYWAVHYGLNPSTVQKHLKNYLNRRREDEKAK